MKTGQLFCLAVFLGLALSTSTVTTRTFAQDIIGPDDEKKPAAEPQEQPESKPKVAPEGMKPEEEANPTDGEERALLDRLDKLLDTRIQPSDNSEAQQKLIIDHLTQTMDLCNEYLAKFPKGAKVREVGFRKSWLFYQFHRYSRKAEYVKAGLDQAASLIADNPKDKWACKAHGIRLQFFRAAGDWNGVVVEGQAIVQQFPQDETAPETAYHVYDAYRRKQDPAKAREALQTLATKFPESPWGVKAAGMLRRPDLPGKPLEMQFPDFKLSDKRGKVVLVTFWSTQAEPSLAYQKALKQLYDLYSADGLEIIGVSLDPSTELFEKTKAALGLPWVQVCDEKAYLGPMVTAVGVTVLPSTVLVDRQGVVYGLDIDLPSQQLRKAIVECLGRK